MTFAEMKKISKAADKHYFDKDALEFWGSKFECEPNTNNIFVESVDDFYKKDRLYKVMSFTLDGRTHDIKPMQVEKNSPCFFTTLQSALDFRDKLSDCIDGQPKKCEDNLDGTYTYSFDNGTTHIVDANALYNDMLAEELAEYAYQTVGSWSEDAQKKANMSLEINDMGYGLNQTREWGLNEIDLRKVIDKAEKIYDEEYADDELDMTEQTERGR